MLTKASPGKTFEKLFFQNWRHHRLALSWTTFSRVIIDLSRPIRRQSVLYNKIKLHNSKRGRAELVFVIGHELFITGCSNGYQRHYLWTLWLQFRNVGDFFISLISLSLSLSLFGTVYLLIAVCSWCNIPSDTHPYYVFINLSKTIFCRLVGIKGILQSIHSIIDQIISH